MDYYFQKWTTHISRRKYNGHNREEGNKMTKVCTKDERVKMTKTAIPVEAQQQEEKRAVKNNMKYEIMTGIRAKGFNLQDSQCRKLWKFGEGRQQQL